MWKKLAMRRIKYLEKRLEELNGDYWVLVCDIGVNVDALRSINKTSEIVVPATSNASRSISSDLRLLKSVSRNIDRMNKAIKMYN